MIDHQSHYYHEQNQRQQDWAIGPWLRKKGMTVKDLDSHPQVDDLITLITIREQLWYSMTHREQCSWGKYWDLVYQYKYPLSQKFWNKFNTIAKQIDNRQQTRQHIVENRKQGSR